MLQTPLQYLVTLLLVIAISPAGADPLASRASEIMEQRCMVCHGCYDAPCQLKLEARAGLERGASKALVYDGARLRPAEMTRLFDDGFTERRWRKKGFYPVVDTENPSAGVMYRMLELKQQHPLPTSGPLPDSFDLSLYREQQCPKQDEFDQFAQDYPQWGMPFALPGLNEAEQRDMLAWLNSGAPAEPRLPLSKTQQGMVQQWEAFLNGNSAKEQLMARYVYEHLFLANLYFESSDDITWFRLVRSATPPGEDIELIVSRRPFDDPGVDKFYYRIQTMPVTPLVKIHIPYRFDQARLARYRELFLEAKYEVASLPGYDAEAAANPFKSFQAIPIKSRYQFLLDEAQFTIMNFIKGPVCRGSVALNVIDDRFWVMFTNPNDVDAEQDEAFLAREAHNLRIPTVNRGTPVDLLVWNRYAKAEQRYQKARADYMREELASEHRGIGPESIWDGGGENPNAALTIFRHFDSATVVKGWVGDIPKTAWVIGYPLLERIHYLLVANFDVYGPVSHQLESRLYMDFLRFEGENNFLMFMPAETRRELQAHWYRDAPRSVSKYMNERNAVVVQEAESGYKTDDPKREFLTHMKQRIHGADAHPWDYRASASPTIREAFEELERNHGAHNSYLPNVTFLNIIGNERDEVYSLVRNSGYSNIAQLFKEEKRRLPEEDSLTVARGFLGAYPNYFLMVNEKEIGDLARRIAQIKTPADYDAILERWGVHRTDPWFWRVSDKFHRMLRTAEPVDGGLLDLNRYRARR